MRVHHHLATRFAIVTLAIGCAAFACSRATVPPSRDATSSPVAANRTVTPTAYRPARPSSNIAYEGEEGIPHRPPMAATKSALPVTAGEPIVIVVVPETAPNTKTYHLVVTTDLRTATVAIDGHPPAAARVQRVRSDSPAAAPLRAASPSSPAPYEVTPANVRGAESRLPPRASASRLTLGSRPIVMNPNGAPILD